MFGCSADRQKEFLQFNHQSLCLDYLRDNSNTDNEDSFSTFITPGIELDSGLDSGPDSRPDSGHAASSETLNLSFLGGFTP